MARGQKQAADTQLKKTNAVGDTEMSKASGLESQITPGYTSLMDTGYLSPQEEGAATSSEMGSAMQPFEEKGFEANNRAATTNNAADVTAQQDQLARDKGITAGEAAMNLENQKMQNQEAGMYGLGQLKSQDQQSADSMYGLGPSTLGSRAAGGGWSQGFSQVASALMPKGLGGGGNG